MSIHVLIADDHPIVRSGIRSELARHPDFVVTGEALNGDEALQLTAELKPDVLLLDVNMPGVKAIKVLEAIKRKPAPCKVLILTAYGDIATILGMLQAGANGYILKDEDPCVIPEAILEVLDGKTWLSKAVYEKLTLVSKRNESFGGVELTKREMEVLRLISIGNTNKEIATTLNMAERTVEFHLGNIFNKLDVKGRLEAAVWARENGLV